MFQVNYTSEKQPAVASMMFNSNSVQIRGLLPFTVYTVAVGAFTNNTKLLTGPSCYVKTRTAVGGICEKCYRSSVLYHSQPFYASVPPTPKRPQLVLKATRTDNTVVLSLPTLNETNGPIRLTMHFLSAWHVS